MTSDPQWLPCEPGTLDSLKQPRSAPMTRRRILAAAVVAAVGGGVLLIRGRNSDSITCAQVMELASQYINGELTVELSVRIDRHRGHCAACDKHLAELEQRRHQPV